MLPVLWAVVGLVEIVVFAALCGAIADSYEVATGAITFKKWILVGIEVFRSVLLPFVGGCGIGALLFSLYRTGALQEKAAFGVSSLIAAAALTFLVATDRQYGWFTRLSKVSLASAELDFASSRPQDYVPAGAAPNADPAVVYGPEAIDQSLQFIGEIASDILIDRGYVNGMSPRFDIEDEINPDLEFMKAIVIPLVLSLKQIHERRASTDISLYIKSETIYRIRNLANLNYSPDELEAYLKTFKDEINEIWRNVCNTEHWYNEIRPKSINDKNCDKSGQPKNQKEIEAYFDAPYPYEGGQPDNQKEIDDYLEIVYPRNRLLSPDRPYGQLLSAWLLVGKGEPDEAYHDLWNWLQRKKTEGKGNSWKTSIAFVR